MNARKDRAPELFRESISLTISRVESVAAKPYVGRAGAAAAAPPPRPPPLPAPPPPLRPGAPFGKQTDQFPI
ncbi:unnamed protein product, partial [Iphiclides podalirius]